MNLCFVWVSNFKNLQDFSAGLSNHIGFQYDMKTQTLHCFDKDPMPKLFGEKVTSITGILGLNGAGKTNTLELICRVLKTPEKLKSDYLVVYEIDNKFFYASNIKTKINSSFEIFESQKNDLDFFHTIYFSNVYDKNYLDFGGSVVDVSTNNKNNPRTLALQKDNRESDFQNDLDFLESKEFRLIELAPPSRIEIKIDKSISSRHDHPLRNEKTQAITNYFSEIRKLNRRKGKLELATLTIQIEFLIGLVLSKSYDDEFLQFLTSNIPSETAVDPEINNYILNIRERFVQGNESIPWNSNFFMFESLTLLLQLESFLAAMNFWMDETLKSSRYIFTIDYDRSENFYYRHLACLLQGMRFSSITWAGISSGQRAYLNLFSSIWNGVRNNPFKERERKATLICIDEGDLYLHPQWQLEFVDRLINSLPELSGGKIQVIFTTHSPILISDLPHQCIVLLTHDREQLMLSPDNSFGRPKSFGANFYDIYQYSFGLKQQRSGNLSSRYLKSIFFMLDKENLSIEENNALKLAMSVVDDDLVKFYIKKRVDKN